MVRKEASAETATYVNCGRYCISRDSKQSDKIPQTEQVISVSVTKCGFGDGYQNCLPTTVLRKGEAAKTRHPVQRLTAGLISSPSSLVVLLLARSFTQIEKQSKTAVRGRGLFSATALAGQTNKTWTGDSVATS